MIFVISFYFLIVSFSSTLHNKLEIDWRSATQRSMFWRLQNFALLILHAENVEKWKENSSRWKFCRERELQLIVWTIRRELCFDWVGKNFHLLQKRSFSTFFLLHKLEVSLNFHELSEEKCLGRFDLLPSIIGTKQLKPSAFFTG